MRTAFPVAAATLSVACARESLDGDCPPINEGELVVTELRGEQADRDDSLGEWIELLNTSDRDLNVGGLRLEMFPTDGGVPRFVVLRNEGLVVAPGEFVVLGQEDDTNLPDYVDYGFRITDKTPGFFAGARLTVASCDEVIDEIVYSRLPDAGTWSLDGSLEPSAAANDDQEAFCVDQTPPPPGIPATGDAPLGTPGEGNGPCVVP
ncbi:MAG: hypothetical protein AAF721_08150 [Myxococcota bacterium]